jgi:O-antigen/teichoic acid export membrane protein
LWHTACSFVGIGMDCPKAALEASIEQKGEAGVSFRPFDESGAFTLAAKDQEIRRLAVQGAGATTLSQVFGLSIQMIATVILARLLTPEDFGLVTMVTTFSLLFMNAGGNGFTEVVLQRKEVDHVGVTNLFWINIGTGVVLTVAFAAAGSSIAWFYDNPRVTQVAVGLSLTIFIASTSVIHSALLMRAMRFPMVYANQLLARLVSVAVSILLAWAGWGYWALVGGAIAQPLSESVGAWSLCRWTPGLPRQAYGTGSMVGFALNVYGRFSFNYFSRNVDNLLVGWRFNAQSLGFYKKAYDLFALSAVPQSLTSVAVSTLSRLSHDSQKYKRYLLKALSISAFLGMGLGGALTLVGRDFIRVLLGPKWEPAGQIFTFFGPGFGIMFVYGIHGWIHLSIGKPGRWLRWGIIEFCVTGSLLVLALRWGPAAVATSWSLSLLILTIPALWYASRPIGFGIAPMIAAVWKFFAASLLAGCATVVIVGGFRFFAPASDLVEAAARIAKISLLFSVLYVSAVTILHRSLTPLYQVADLLREMRHSGRPLKVSSISSERVKVIV